MNKLTKQEFQTYINKLIASSSDKKGKTIEKIAKNIGYSVSQLNRARSDKWAGDCSKVINAFDRTFK